MASRWKRASAAVAISAVVAVGCSGTGDTVAGDDPGGASDPATSTADGCSLPDGGVTVAETLAFVADTPNNRADVTVANLRAYLDHQGTSLPDGFRDTVWASGPVQRFSATPLLRQEIQSLANGSDGLAEEYGIDIGQVDQAMRFGEPPVVTELVIGTVDATAVGDAVASDGLWSDSLEKVEIAGQQVYSWGEDNRTELNKRSAMRDVGIGGRMWPGDGVAAFTGASAPMAEVLAACSGSTSSLADDADFAGIAEHLGAFDGAFSVTLTDQVPSVDDVASPPGSAPAGTTRPAADTAGGGATDVNTLGGVTAYGYASGPSDDPDQARIRLVIAADTEAQAEANEQRFTDQVDNGESIRTRTPWSDVVRIERSELDGRFLIVELLADNTSVLDNNRFVRDTLIVADA